MFTSHKESELKDDQSSDIDDILVSQPFLQLPPLMSRNATTTMSRSINYSPELSMWTPSFVHGGSSMEDFRRCIVESETNSSRDKKSYFKAMDFEVILKASRDLTH